MTLPMLPPHDRPHLEQFTPGVSCYSHGCRCYEGLLATRDRQREYRRRRYGRIPPGEAERVHDDAVDALLELLHRDR